MGSELIIVTVGKGHVLSLLHLLLHLSELVLGDGDLGGSENGCLNQSEVGVVDETAEEPDEGLLELVVALGGDVVVLEVLLTVESDLLGLDLALTHVDLVADEDDVDVLTDAGQILVPLGHVGVGDARADIEHDDAALATNVIAVAETAKFLLTGSVPHVELDLAVVSEECHRVDFDTECSDVALLELASQMTLDERGLADTAVTDEHELEFRNLRDLLNHFVVYLRKNTDEVRHCKLVAFKAASMRHFQKVSICLELVMKLELNLTSHLSGPSCIVNRLRSFLVNQPSQNI